LIIPPPEIFLRITGHRLAGWDLLRPCDWSRDQTWADSFCLGEPRFVDYF
jgi:hypothetical protein